MRYRCRVVGLHIRWRATDIGCDFLFLMSQVRDDALGSLSRERDTTEIPHGARIGLNREVRSDTGAVPPL
jgi:hypothetical protein